MCVYEGRRELASEGIGVGGNWRRRELASEGIGVGGNWRRRELASEDWRVRIGGNCRWWCASVCVKRDWL
jgi:hypothetical protein